MSKFDFKPFDKVLARGNGDICTWKIEFFERENVGDPVFPYVCMNYNYAECIPYNEETKHLLGTNKPYMTEEDEATKYTPGEIVECWLSEDIWEETIYLEFKAPFSSGGGGHRIYNKKLGVCTQPPNEIRKKGEVV